MMILNQISLIFFILLLAAVPAAHSGDVTIPNTFKAGTPAVATEVNENFEALKAVLTELQAIITTQAETIAALQNRLDTVETSEVMALDDYLTVDDIGDPRGAMIQLSGVNLQITNGLGSTNTINGLGNLIIGYDEVNRIRSIYRCSNGDYTDQASCEGADESWSNSHKTGSHYLVTGFGNNYSQYGGMVAGQSNFATGRYGTVTCGWGNTASGANSSVSGGRSNTSDGYCSNVSGGAENSATVESSSVSGGYQNTARGGYSSISGGRDRGTTGQFDWIAGGLFEDL
ncbi:MAG: hypothetical protein HKM93_00785 [Desulfobacteraceae bacterium]|nr:hypothetical protein [Desulfobacteraceae bacterium]